MTAINVLDHGLVRLVDSMGSDLSIVRNARVSYDAEWRTGEDAGGGEKLQLIEPIVPIAVAAYRAGRGTP